MEQRSTTLAVALRSAQSNDIDGLLLLENACFSSDRISRRSFRRLLRGDHSACLVAETENGALLGYVLLLFRRGSSLARIYSIAVDQQRRGTGVGKLLLQGAEQLALARDCLFIRLEVRADNAIAQAFYQAMEYRIFDRIDGYYDDAEAALRLEKSLLKQRASVAADSVYYAQTTPFSCGPAALMMAMHTLDPGRCRLGQRTELQLWREATTIFMTAGHGGCSPEGLALSAWRRGYRVTLYQQSRDTPFIDSVRDPRKKKIIEIVHQDFVERMAETDIEYRCSPITPEQLEGHIKAGDALISLISTWRLNRNKAPHWVFVTDSDNNFVYLNDPDIDEDSPHPVTDNIRLPVTWGDFQRMACFGSLRLKATLVLSAPRDASTSEACRLEH